MGSSSSKATDKRDRSLPEYLDYQGNLDPRYTRTRGKDGPTREIDAGSGFGGRFFGSWPLTIAVLLALIATIVYVLPVFAGIPLSQGENQSDHGNVFLVVRDSPEAKPKSDGSGMEWRFGISGFCIQPDGKTYNTLNRCVVDWFYDTDKHPEDIPYEFPASVARSLSYMGFIVFLTGIQTIVYFILLAFLFFSGKRYWAPAMYVGPISLILPLVSMIGILVIVIPQWSASQAAQTPDIAKPGPATWGCITGFVMLLLSVILWVMASEGDSFEKLRAQDEKEFEKKMKSKG